MSGKQSVDRFMDACGARGALHLSIKEAGRLGASGRHFSLPFAFIGRTTPADLVLDHPDIHPRHAYLQLVDGRLLCVGLGGKSALTWDDGAVKSGWLDHGRSVLLGPYAIARRDNADMSAPARADARRPRGFMVEVLDSPQGRPTRAVRVLRLLSLVGRSPTCHVRLDHPDVANAHCSLVETTDGLWAIDLLGRGGISVNGELVRFSRVDDGDLLRVGPHHLRIGLDAYPPWSLPQPVPAALAVPARPVTDDPAGGLAVELLAGQPELIKAMMEPMVRQFGIMQRQMFDQFHQAMMGMFESIGGTYRDQMDDLRDELEEVRRITRELHALQSEAEARRPLRPQLEAGDDEVIIRRPPPTKSDAGVHGVLIDRIARLQDDRQTRWQRILARVNRTSL